MIWVIPRILHGFHLSFPLFAGSAKLLHGRIYAVLEANERVFRPQGGTDLFARNNLPLGFQQQAEYLHRFVRMGTLGPSRSRRFAVLN
jgi:hypothetical protein